MDKKEFKTLCKTFVNAEKEILKLANKREDAIAKLHKKYDFEEDHFIEQYDHIQSIDFKSERIFLINDVFGYGAGTVDLTFDELANPEKHLEKIEELLRKERASFDADDRKREAEKEQHEFNEYERLKKKYESTEIKPTHKCKCEGQKKKGK